jgi:1-acyl-sn-glycerol-3-phosphate acyltransferase
VIFSALPRDDLKLIISGVPVVRALPGASKYLIYTPYDIRQRTAVVREAIRHLKDGGLLIIFPTGKIDPDPAFLPGAVQSLDGWSKSLEIFLRRAPGTGVIPTIVSGVLDPSTLRNPLTKLRREFWMQQRVAVYIQVAQMLTFHKKFELTPRVTFGNPVYCEVSDQAGYSDDTMALIRASAKELLGKHTSSVLEKT